jgi:hypothetical protein
VHLDAVFSEWPAMIDTQLLSEAGPGAAFSTGLATDDSSLYVAARLRQWDNAKGEKERIQVRLWFLKGGVHGPPLDLSLEIPAGRRGAGTASLGPAGGAPTILRGAEVHVEPHTRGFNLEASIPWKAIPLARESLLGLRGAVGYEFQGRWTSGILVGFGYPDGTLVPLPMEQTLLSSLDADAHRLWPGATRSWIDAGGDMPHAADLLGDARLERIGKMGGQVSICEIESPGRAGRCQRLDYGAASRIEAIETHDVLGRGKDDLIIRYWKPTGAADHHVLEVLSPGASGQFRPVFRHELAVHMHCCGNEGNAAPNVRSEAKISTGSIEIRADKAWRLTRKTFKEPPLGDGILPLVTPWDASTRRHYVVKEGRFVAD